MSSFDPTRPGVVYALVDPRTDAVRYIGATQVDPALRLRRHMAGSWPTRYWSDELLSHGVAPVIRVLREVPAGENLHGAERALIHEHALAGADLLNIEGNPLTWMTRDEAREADDQPPLMDWLVAEGYLTPGEAARIVAIQGGTPNTDTEAPDTD